MGRLGYGIVSYFQLIYTFLVIFFLMFAGHIPVMYNYATWKAYEGEKQLSLTTQLTIGNLGQSMPRCTTIQMVGNNLPIGCNTGLISNFTQMGVYAFDSPAYDAGVCSANAGDATNLECDSVSNTDSALFSKVQECIGKQSCIIDDVHDYIAVGTQTFDPGCSIDEKDMLYVQYMCQVPYDDLYTKRREALLAGCISIFACLVLLAVIQNREGAISIEKREWDLLTVTASDYTLEIPISLTQVIEMRNRIYSNSFERYEAEGLKLKLWLTKRIEDQLNELSGGAPSAGGVASIDFTYNNSWVLEGLRERGTAIINQDWKKLNEVNRSMNEQLAADLELENKNYYKEANEPTIPRIVDPITAFVTMETEESYNNLSAMDEIQLGGEPSTVSEALEPTNILWQNYDMPFWARAARFMAIVFTTTMVLGLVFVIAFIAKDAQKDLIGKYDVSIKCSELAKIYSKPQLSNLAADEWLNYYKNGGED